MIDQRLAVVTAIALLFGAPRLARTMGEPARRFAVDSYLGAESSRLMVEIEPDQVAAGRRMAEMAVGKGQGLDLPIFTSALPSHGVLTPFRRIGQWLLYRYNPDRTARGENALQLDSRGIKIPVEQFLKMENRFNQLLKGNDDHARELLAAAQRDVNTRWQMYSYLASRKPENAAT